MMPELSAPTLPARYFFVYGTLRAGGSNDITRYRSMPQRIGEAVVHGTLYDLGPYPGLRLDGASPVMGEVYRIDATLEPALDVLESVAVDDSGEYLKRTVWLEVAVGPAVERLECLVYEIHPDRLAGRAEIAGGDWIAHLRERGAGGKKS